MRRHNSPKYILIAAVIAISIGAYYAFAVDRTGLVGYWTFDNNDTYASTTYDKSGYGNNGTIYGNPATGTDGVLREAITFDGAGDYVDAGSGASLNPTSALTLEAWVKKSATKAQDILFNDVHELKLDSSDNAVLRLMTGGRLGVDFDMEAVDVNSWGVFNSPAIRQKNTTNPIQGNRDLRVVARDTATHDGVYQCGGSVGLTHRIKVSYKVVSGSLNINFGSSPQANGGQGNVGLGLTGSGTVIAYVTPVDASCLMMVTKYAGEFYVDDIEIKRVGATLTSSGTVSSDFTHIAATYDGSISKMYINGVLDNSLTQAVTLSSDNLATLIGAGAIGGTGYGQDFFNGLIDDVRIYNRALSAEEILNNYNASKKQYATAVNTTGLVGYWNFDDNDTYASTTYDKSGYANNGTIYGNPATGTEGVLREAITFDGNGDYVGVGDKAILDLGTSNFTLEAWIKNSAPITTDASVYTIINKGEDNSGYNLLLRGGVYNGVYMRTRVGGTITQVYPSTDYRSILSNGNWHHIVSTRNGTALAIYIDGIEVGTSTGTVVNLGNTVSFMIGTVYTADSSWFNGFIDEVRIYNRALSATEILNNYNASKKQYATAVNTTGLVGYWNFDDNDTYASTTYDKSGYGNNGTIYGNPATGTEGVLREAITFDGNGDYVDCGDDNALRSVSAWTWELWVYRASDSGTEETILSLSDGSSRDRWLWISSSDRIQHQFIDTTGGYRSLEGTQGATLNTGAWHHVAVTWDSSRLKLYFDGAYYNQSNDFSAYTPRTTVGRGFKIGRAVSTYSFNGSIDEVRIYNRALSAEEVLNNYNATKRIYVE